MSVLAGLVFLEALALVGALIYLVIEIIAAPKASLASSIALAVCAAIAAAGLILVARGILQGKPWIRGASITWQIVQGLVGYSVYIAKPPHPVLAAVLIVPAVVVIVLLFTPRVLAWTSRTRP